MLSEGIGARTVQEAKPTVLGGRLDGLQIGRALAALTVVVGHAVNHPLRDQSSELWQLAARYGVTLFFVISGFIMIQTTGSGRFDPAGFMSRRIRRVVPLYWFVTLVVAALALVLPSLFQHTIFSIRHLLASLFFIPMYDPADPTSVSPLFRLGWTLNFEMFFYVIFATTFAMGLLKRAVVLSLFFGACIIVGQMIHFKAAIPEFYTRIDTLGFVAGVWLGVLNLRGKLRFDTMILGALFVISTGLLGYIALGYQTLQLVPITQVWLVLVCAAHIVLLLTIIDRRDVEMPRPFLHLGDASYSMYLSHMFAVGFVTALIFRLPNFLLYPLICVSAVAGIIIGLVVYRFVEKPLNRLMRGRKPLTAAQIDTGSPMPASSSPEQSG